jgi:putative SOS response-associated peptidase YedK
MCGRYVSKEEAAIERVWNLTRGGGDPFGARYNAAPTMRLPIVRVRPDGNRELTLLRWGLIPSWAKDPSIGAKMINARGETVAEKPAFQAALKSRRCLVPMAGFYEWQKTPAGKVPHYIHPLNSEFFGVAGLYECWPGKNGLEPIESYTIITTEANEMMAKLHDRMPVILHGQDYDAWLDPKNNDAEALKALLRPCASEEMRAYPISTRVNGVKNDDESLIQELASA